MNQSSKSTAIVDDKGLDGDLNPEYTLRMIRLSLFRWIFGGLILLFFPIVHCSGQTPSSPSIQQTIVVLTKLSPPVYPAIALQARITGDIELALDIRQDGKVASAVVTSGPPLLQQAALNSAKQSQFECHKCSETVTDYRLLYTFKVVELRVSCSVPEDCNKTVPVQHAPEVTQLENHITLVIEAAGLCICDVIKKVRSLKCLYLWRCGLS